MGSDSWLCGNLFILIEVSIHTPAWGVTSYIPTTTIPVTSFNPHSRMGSDLMFEHFETAGKVSIHTPAWGVTHSI